MPSDTLARRVSFKTIRASNIHLLTGLYFVIGYLGPMTARLPDTFFVLALTALVLNINLHAHAATLYFADGPAPRVLSLPHPKTMDELQKALGLPHTPSTMPAPAPVLPASTCLADLKTLKIEATEASAPMSSNSFCTIDMPVKLVSVTLGDGAQIKFTDTPLLACTFAKELGAYVAKVLNPLAVASLGANLSEIGTGPGYECRFRNRASSGKMSEHAHGLAADIQHFKTAAQPSFSFSGAAASGEKEFVGLFPRSACGFFATVLGPSSGDMHKDHIHVDMEPRRQRYGSFCQP